MDLLKLPPVVLMKILQYVGIEDTVASVSRVCWYLHDFVSETPLIWTHFTMERRTCAINFTNEQQISAVFKHSAYFHCFDVPGINPVYPLEQFFDQCLNSSLLRSSHLTWLDLSGCPVVHLDFLQGCISLETLILGDCTEIISESFGHMSKLDKLFYLDAGFTSLTGEILSQSVHGPVVHIEVCGVIVNLEQLERILEKCELQSIRFQLPEDTPFEDFSNFTKRYRSVCFGLNPTNFPYYSFNR